MTTHDTTTHDRLKPTLVRRSAVALAALAAGALLAATAGASAEAQGRAHFAFEPGRMENAVVGVEGARSTRYFLPYKVTNAAGDARRPDVRLELRTDTGKTYDDRYDPWVFRAAKERMRRAEPFQSSAALRQTEVEPGKGGEALANFGAIDPHADVLEVWVHGLWDPVVRDRRGVVRTERRVLVLTFDRPGDEYHRHLDPVRLRSRREVLESEPVELH
jgi:hypothetical protein